MRLLETGSLAVCRAQPEFTTWWPTTYPPASSSPTGCEYNGRIYPPGTTISETTGCMGSGTYCDENGQILVSDNFGYGCCERDGQYYEDGDTFTEGGVTCTCVGSQDAQPAPLNCAVTTTPDLPPACGENSSFDPCGHGDCQPTCENPAPICTQVCIAGCQCDAGFVLQDGECIPRSQCEGGGSDIEGDCRGSWSTPEGCRGDACDHSVSWTYNSDTDKIFFEMSARQTNDKWIGIGFSNDQRMVRCCYW
ncbi:Hypp1793 [Branchiostoma lanceolatum]|uniref:Hypp1793 protein n=1 Tax=Branchiostoma lanceolatum TaxID=7740 RepID=A0A8K0EPU1_BRALA|nr:Hypp1793 [Branchiostoma lanceolatum]